MGIWDKVRARGKYRVLCDQDEMSHTSPHDYSDSRRGAEAIKRDDRQRYRGLTFTIQEKNERTGFWEDTD
jgi:hypothetical protein